MTRNSFVLIAMVGSIVTASAAWCQPVAVPGQQPPAAATPGQQPPKLLVPPFPIPQAPQPAGTPAPMPNWMSIYYRPMKVPKGDAHLMPNGRVWVSRMFNRAFDLIGEEGDYYIVRNIALEDPKSPMHRDWLEQQYNSIMGEEKEEYLKDKYIIVDQPDLYPPFTTKLDFVRRDVGLPRQGRWQMSFDVADMNGDGRLDLVLPPERLGEGHPWIVLQQKDGSWVRDENVKWPSDLKLDYGTVRVADFDGDGNLDIAITCHFGGTYVLYGNGKGDFTRWVQVPRANPNVTARSMVVADFNKDGRPDIATLAEIDLDLATDKSINMGLVNVALNLPSGWKATSDGFSSFIHGDWLSAADLDGDGWPDLLLTSRNLGITDVIMRNVGKGEKFAPMASLQVPVAAYIFANAAGPLDRFPNPDAVYCFEQFNPRTSGGVPAQACVIYRFHDADGRPIQTPTTQLLFKQTEEYHNVKGVAIGDIDGDGRNDIAVITNQGKVRVFLQLTEGEFYEDKSAALDTGGADLFDVKIADLYHNGMGEIIVAGAPREEVKASGGIWVFAPKRVAAKGGRAGR